MHAPGNPFGGAAGRVAAARNGPWEIDSDRGRLIVTQSAAAEWPSPAGSPAEKPELVLRCAGGEKEVYLYFAHGFPSKEGDLFVRFEDGRSFCSASGCGSARYGTNNGNGRARSRSRARARFRAEVHHAIP